MKVRLLSERDSPSGKLPVGAEIDHADAHRLCELGIAEPVDDEAKGMLKTWQMFQDAKREMREEEDRKKRARIAARNDEILKQRRAAFEAALTKPEETGETVRSKAKK